MAYTEKYVNKLEDENLELLRDLKDAKYALSSMFKAATGVSPEWNDMYTYRDAIVEVWRISLSEAEAAALRDVVDYFIMQYQDTTPALDSAIDKLDKILGYI